MSGRYDIEAIWNVPMLPRVAVVVRLRSLHPGGVTSSKFSVCMCVCICMCVHVCVWADGWVTVHVCVFRESCTPGSW